MDLPRCKPFSAFSAISAVSFFVLASCVSAAEPDTAGGEFFESKIRPLLAEHCYKCHSAQAEKLKGKLRLDSLEAMLQGGDTGPAIMPGDPEKSLLIEAVHYKNTDLQMPPKSKLSDAQIADLTAWIKRGAPWPKAATGRDAGATAQPGKNAGPAIEAFDLEKRKTKHWAWKPVQARTPPAVKNAAWPKSPIDNFILAKLEEKNLVPAAPADKRTLIRRAYFDVIGLPPAPQQVDAFMKDTSPDAFEKVVDGLLASPHFGERWGRHWLDLVRYGESRGHEFDFPAPNAWQYRDYAIRALNADLPYDQLVKEHIAGDLLPTPRVHPAEGYNESILGTGFWFLGEALHSPVDIRQDEADRFDNMVDVTCKTFLGLTVACARCHDHKFDAIGTKDYYSLFGFLQSSSYRLARFDTMEHNKKAAQELWKLRADSRPAIARATAQSMRPTLDRLADYLLAAREAIVAGTLGPGSFSGLRVPTTNDVVFENFESGAYDGWEVKGTAFGKAPQTLETIASYQGKINAAGKYFVNSHQIRDGGDTAGGDAHKGSLLSRTFAIEHSFITMLVGGGSHAGKTCVNLIVGGKVVLSATGRDNNQMFPVRWDVRPHKGKNGQIQIVDDAGGGWGNIGVDEIVFTNAGGEPGAGTFTDGHKKRIGEIAAARKLDSAILVAWVSHLLAAATDKNDPFHAWAALASVPQASRLEAGGTTALRALLDPLVESARQREAAAGAALKDAEIVVDYGKLAPGEWLPDGESFGPGPVLPGDIRLGGSPIEQVCERAAAEFDPVFDGLKPAAGAALDPVGLAYNRAGRTIRTRTFALKGGKVCYLAKGKGHVYAAVDSHALINGPLHAKTIQKCDSKEDRGFQWHALDLSAYAGHRAHLEFTGQSPDFAVALVVQAEKTPPPAKRPNALVTELLASAHNSLEDFATAHQKVYLDSVSLLESGAIATNKNAADHAALANWLLGHRELIGGPEPAEAKTFLAAQSKLAGQIKNESRLAMAMLDGSGEDEHVMIRGGWKSKGEIAPRQFLEALGGKNQPMIERGSGRLELASRLADPANPFVTRVMANRVWHHLFGRGIVASVDNFGELGERPTHEELLDWLADQFVKQGWSTKKTIRMVMLSATYQMSSKAGDAHPEQADPDNKLLHRMSIRRLQGEVIRDNILAVSGRLDRKMHGPSVPIFLSDFMQGRGRPASGPLDGEGRRSIYLSVSRNFLSPMMMAFDMPSPFNSMGRRTVSNVPAQALILMNDPLVAQQAQLWAKRVLAEKGLTPEQRIERMYLSAYARPPNSGEVAAALAFLDKQGEEIGIAPAARREDARTWTDLAHVLMNFKEFTFVN